MDRNVDDHMDGHGEQPGPAPGGSAERSEKGYPGCPPYPGKVQMGRLKNIHIAHGRYVCRSNHPDVKRPNPQRKAAFGIPFLLALSPPLPVVVSTDLRPPFPRLAAPVASGGSPSTTNSQRPALERQHLLYIEQDAKQGPPSQFAELAGSGLSVRAQVRRRVSLSHSLLWGFP